MGFSLYLHKIGGDRLIDPDRGGVQEFLWRRRMHMKVIPASSTGLTAAHGLTDHSDELAQIGTIPLEERAGALAAIHEELVSVLHAAEG